MSICTVLDSNTQKFQDILQDNAAASNAVAWSNNNFEGEDIDSKVNKALDFIDKLKNSNPKTKSQADKLIKELLDKHLISQVKTGGGVHYKTNFPELVESVISNKKSVIFYANGNISDDTSIGNYNYLYSKNPIKQNESFMADFDRKTTDEINSVGEGMLGFALMSTDNIVSSEKVNQTVDAIVEKIARRVIAGESLTKQDIQDELDTYYNTFLDIKEEYESNGSQKGVEHTDSYLNNWDNLEQMVFNALKRRSGLSFKNGIDSKKLDDTTIQDEDSVKANNEEIDLDGADKSQGNYSDNFAITLDSKAGLSGKLKLFLSTLENGDSHYLTGESLFENFDTVYNTLNALLAGTDPNIYAMIERLKEFNDYRWVQSLIAKLNEAKAINNETGLQNNMTLIKQFVTAMNKHYIDMSFVQWINSFAGTELKVMGDNANSRQRVILADWNQRLEKSDLVDVDSFGKRTFNPKYANEVITKFDELFESNQNVTESQLFDALNSIGIKLSYTTIKRMLNDGFQYGSRRFKKDGVNQLFLKNDKFSPITNIYNILVKIAATDGNKEVGVDDGLNVFSAGSVKAMADLEAKNSKHLYSNSHNSGTKTVFSYTNDKFIIDRMYELTRGYKTGIQSNFKLLDDLKTDLFANNSYWLNQLLLAKGDNPTPEQLAFSEVFEFGYLSLDALKQANSKASDRGLTDLSPQEIIALKLGLLHNNDSKVGTGVTARRIGKLFYPTMSDKTNMINIQSIIRDNIIYTNNSVDDVTVDFIYRNIVKSEMNRMWEVQQETNNYSTKINIEGYNDGAKYFYTVPELNIVQDIFKKAQNGNRILKTEDELTTENVELIKSTIKNSLNLMIRKQIEEFKDNKIGYVQGEKTLQFIDKTHAQNVSGWYGGKLSQKEISDAVAADFAINYFIHNANVAQLFHGDYAQYFKGETRANGLHNKFESEFFNRTDYTIVDAYNLIKPTFDNLGKRLAADLAPGYEADFGDKQLIKVTVSRDRKMKSLAIDYIDKIYRKNEQNRTTAEKAAIKAYNDINTSDAQSWTSLDFHIDTLFNFGNKNITEKEYYQLKAKIAKAKVDEVDVDFTDREWEIVLQPTKPLYANNRQVSTKNNKSIGVRNYIKTSSFPLIPQLVRGTELESIMKVMEKNGIDIHVFESGYKVGATDMHFDGKDFANGKLELFNDDGSLNQKGVDLLGTENNFIELPIAGFKIQQEVPYHDHPGVVNKGTQEAKLLFSNIKGIGGFKYKGQTYTGSELEKVYNGLYKQLYENEAIKLKDELFIKDESGNPTNTVDIAKLQEILKEEANNRGYSINDIIGLDLNEFDNTFKYPLWALPSARQYESLIISIVDNRVRKLKIPGNSFVLGSEAGFKFKSQVQSGSEGLATIKKYQDRIIFTSNFDGQSLQSYREDGDGMKPSQVFVPAKLQGANGEFIDLMRYTFIKDGKLMLDEDRLPKDLLKMFGFRIPTQGHNSMAALEIAGFLPKECGDLIIASQDLVIQMGSDFDIDKLFTYNYLTKEISDNGVPKVVINNDSNNNLYNDLLDVHLSVFNNNNKDLYSLILSPNGFGKLKIDKSTGLSFEIEKIKQDANGLSGMTNYLSPQYQMSKFFNGTSGKMGCLGIDTKVLMYDGSFKKVQDVVVGDQLMGVDSTPRNVLELCRGTEQMYNIIQNRGINYRVNESHMLSLYHFDPPIYHKPQRNFIRTIDKTKVLREKSEYILNIKLSDFLNKTKQFKTNSLGYKSSGIEFDKKDVSIDPYYIGLWLGDGRTNDIKEIATVDFEIEQYLESNYGIKCSYGPRNISKRCYPGKLNWAFKKEFNVTKCGLNPGEKYIPNNYLYNSKENRLKLLAGLIDSDGGYCKINKQYVFANINKKLINQIVFLTRSLGFYTSITEKEAHISKRGLNEQKLYTIRFVPECDIPVLLPRKKQVKKSNFKNRLHTGISIEKDIVDNYYGFVLDGDHLFMLEDFTVTHNTGVFSSLSMLNAMSQNKNLKYINQPVVDGKRLNMFDIQFGDLKSDGKLGNLKTLDGKTYISKVIEAFQSASVDNEKEQILYKLNINKNTVNVINALAMLGFDEETICYFINQPIIEEYVKRSAERDSSLNKFSESLNGDLFQQMITEFSDKYKTQINHGFRSAGVEDLKSQMKLNIDQRNAIAQEFWGKQLAVLEKFKDLNDIGLNLQSLMQTVNAESKGLGRSIFGSIDRENKIDNIDSVNDNLQENASAVGVLNAGELLDETMNGFVSDYGTRNLNILGSQIFPYKNKSLLKMFKYASDILERKGSSISSNEEFMNQMFQATKSYLFSNPELFGEDFDIIKERKRLFLGESELVSNGIQGLLAKTNLVVKTPSLAEIVSAIKETKFGESNALLRLLSTDLSQRSSEFKLIKYMASTGQNLDESDLHQAFISLFKEDIQIPYTLDKKQRYISSRKLAEDLIKYTYLSGGIQEAIQFTRYIPIEVLAYMGFNEKLKTIGNEMNDGTFGNSTDDRGNTTESRLVEQYLQHNPKLIPTKLGSVHLGADPIKGIKDVQYSSGKNGINVITRFKPIISKKVEESTGAYLMGKKYVAASYLVSQPNEKAKYEQMIYKWNGEEFVSIPVLGSFGVDEYNYNSDTLSTESVLDTRNVIKQPKVDIKNDKSGTLLKEEPTNLFKDYNQDVINKSGNAVKSILETIAAKENVEGHNKYQVDLANKLLNNIHILNSLSGVKFLYSDGLAGKGNYNHISDLIKINSKQDQFRNAEHLDETFLHEIIHAYTVKNLKLIFNDKFRQANQEEYDSLPSEVLNAARKIDSIRRGLIHVAKQNISEFNDSLDRVKKFLDPKTRDASQFQPGDELAYGLYSPQEFVSMAMTNDKFRAELDKLGLHSQLKESPLNRLWNAILDFLGLSDMSKVNKDYVTNEILQFIETIEDSKDLSKEKSQPTKIFDNEKYREVEKLLDEINDEVRPETTVESDLPQFNDDNRVVFKDNVDLYKRFKLASDKGVRKIYKSSNKEMNAWIKKINDTNSNYHVESVNYDTKGNKMATIYRISTENGGLNNIFLEPTESEIIKLKEKHGPDALEIYNRLTLREKESVLKCL